MLFALTSCENELQIEDETTVSPPVSQITTDTSISKSRISDSEDFYNGYAWVKIDNSWSIINVKGEVIGCNPDIKDIKTGFSKTGFSIVNDYQTSGLDIVNTDGNIIYTLQQNESILSYDEYKPNEIVSEMDYGYLFIVRNEDTWDRSGTFIYRLNLSNAQMEDRTYLFKDPDDDWFDPTISPVQNGWFLISSYYEFYNMPEDKVFQFYKRENIEYDIDYSLVHDEDKVYYLYDANGYDSLITTDNYIRLDFLESPEYSEDYTIFTFDDNDPENMIHNYAYLDTIKSGMLLHRETSINTDNQESLTGYELLLYDIDSNTVTKKSSPNIERNINFIYYDESSQRVAVIAKNDVNSSYFNVLDKNGEPMLDWIACYNFNANIYNILHDNPFLLVDDYAFVYSDFNTKVYDLNTGTLVKELPGKIWSYDKNNQILSTTFKNDNEAGSWAYYYNLSNLGESDLTDFLRVRSQYGFYDMYDGYINAYVGEYTDRDGNTLQLSDPYGILNHS